MFDIIFIARLFFFVFCYCIIGIIVMAWFYGTMENILRKYRSEQIIQDEPNTWVLIWPLVLLFLFIINFSKIIKNIFSTLTTIMNIIGELIMVCISEVFR